MLGLLKKLFGRSGGSEAPAKPSQDSGAAPHFKSTAPPPPAREPASSRTAKPPAARPAATGAGDTLALPLGPIIAGLPEALRSRVPRPPGSSETITVSLQSVTDQLATGAVRLSFGELRQLAPPGVFIDSPDQDESLVELPLSVVLPLIPSGALKRRGDQKRTDIPDEVTPLFGLKGEALMQAHTPPPTASPGPRSPAPAAARSPAPPTAAPRPTFTPPPKAGPEAKAPAAAPPPQKPPASSVGRAPAPTPAAAPGTPAARSPVPPAQPTVQRPAAPIQMPRGPAAPTAPQKPAGTPGSPTVPIKPAPAAPAAKPPTAPLPGTRPQAPAAAPPSSAPAPKLSIASATSPAPAEAGVTGTLSLPVSAISAAWPDAIKALLAQTGYTSAKVLLPAENIEAGLKHGSVKFPWADLRSWVEPALPAGAAGEYDETELDLPLAIVAPAFLSHFKPSRTQRKVVIGENIPDLFQGKIPSLAPSVEVASVEVKSGTAPATPPKPAPAAASAPTMPAPAVSAAPASAPAPKTLEIGALLGEPGRKNWSPVEIAQRAVETQGLAGAVVASEDGMVVSGRVTAPMTAQTVAAFVPQLFSRVMQYSAEMKLPASDSLTLTIGETPMYVAKRGNLLFAAVARKGESLPIEALKVIANSVGAPTR